ncbi:plasma membrane fusion protein prm1 [Didymella keratinophila]|nr:plasma membrane fusion protein prm1 [Didymella keratinophila]
MAHQVVDAARTTSMHPLGRSERLSQVCLNRWTILLLLVLARILFAIQDARSSLATARREALEGCAQVESIGSSIASMPNYMAAGVNDLTARGLEHAVGALAATLDMAVTSVEQIVLFVVHMMTSTYLCLITLAARGSIKAVADVSSDMAEQLQQSIGEITSSLDDASATLSKALADLQKKLDKVPLASDWKLPSADLTDQISRLKSLELSSGLRDGVDKLGDSVPTFEEAQGYVDDLIKVPFEHAREGIQAMGALRFNRTLLPVPQKQQLEFCSKSSSISDFFDDLLRITVQARTIALSVLIPLAVLLCIAEVCVIMSRVNVHRPRVLISRSSSTAKRRDWLFAYATTPLMLFVLSLGVAGLLACLLQFALMKVIERATPSLTRQVVDFAEDTVRSLNRTSLAWSVGATDAIRTLDEQINKDVFGFVNATTTAVNSTLDAFVEQTNRELNSTLGGTVLRDPVQEVLRCLVGLKIASFQNGLTWVQEHAHISFPDVRNDTFTLGALDQLGGSDSAADLLSNADGKAGDAITAALHRAVDKLATHIRDEAVVFSSLVGLWLLFTAGAALYISGASFVERRGEPVANMKVQFGRRVQNKHDATAPQS